MSPKAIASQVLKRHPELKEIGPRRLKLVRRVIEEAVEYSSRDLMSPEETREMFRRLVPDSGKPSAALRAYRYREDLTQRELARRSGVPQPHIAAMESGKRVIGLNIAKKLARALNCNYRRLV